MNDPTPMYIFFSLLLSIVLFLFLIIALHACHKKVRDVRRRGRVTRARKERRVERNNILPQINEEPEEDTDDDTEMLEMDCYDNPTILQASTPSHLSDDELNMLHHQLRQHANWINSIQMQMPHIQDEEDRMNLAIEYQEHVYFMQQCHQKIQSTLELREKARLGLFIDSPPSSIENNPSPPLSSNNLENAEQSTQSIHQQNPIKKPPRSTNVTNKENESHAPMHQSASAPMHQSATAPMHQSATAPMHQSASAPMHQSASAPMHQSATASMHQSATASMHQSATASMHQSATASMHQSATASMHQSATASMHQSDFAQNQQTNPTQHIASPSVQQLSPASMQQPASPQQPTPAHMQQPGANQETTSAPMQQPGANQETTPAPMQQSGPAQQSTPAPMQQSGPTQQSTPAPMQQSGPTQQPTPSPMQQSGPAQQPALAQQQPISLPQKGDSQNVHGASLSKTEKSVDDTNSSNSSSPVKNNPLFSFDEIQRQLSAMEEISLKVPVNDLNKLSEAKMISILQSDSVQTPIPVAITNQPGNQTLGDPSSSLVIKKETTKSQQPTVDQRTNLQQNNKEQSMAQENKIHQENIHTPATSDRSTMPAQIPLHQVRPGRNPQHHVRPGRNPQHQVRPDRNPQHHVRQGRNPQRQVRQGRNTQHQVRPGQVHQQHQVRPGQVHQQHQVRPGQVHQQHQVRPGQVHQQHQVRPGQVHQQHQVRPGQVHQQHQVRPGQVPQQHQVGPGQVPQQHQVRPGQVPQQHQVRPDQVPQQQRNPHHFQTLPTRIGWHVEPNPNNPLGIQPSFPQSNSMNSSIDNLTTMDNRSRRGNASLTEQEVLRVHNISGTPLLDLSCLSTDVKEPFEIALTRSRSKSVDYIFQ